MRTRIIKRHAATFSLLVLGVVLQAGCSKEAVYVRESFDTDSPFKLKVEDSAAIACESARRSLLGQGYLIDSASAEKVKGRKAYKSEDNHSTFIEMNVDCIPERRGSSLFANGVLSTYDLKMSGNSASVGVSAVGSISLPFGRSADSLVKVAEETISDSNFYSRFFAAVEHILGEMRDDGTVEPAAAPVIAAETLSEPQAGPGAVAVVPAPDAAQTPLEIGSQPTEIVAPDPEHAQPAIAIEQGPDTAAGNLPPQTGPAQTAPVPVDTTAPAAQPAEPVAGSKRFDLYGNPVNGQLFDIVGSDLGKLERARLEGEKARALDELRDFFAANELVFGDARKYSYVIDGLADAGTGSADGAWTLRFHQLVNDTAVEGSTITAASDALQIRLHLANPANPDFNPANWLDRTTLRQVLRRAVEEQKVLFDAILLDTERFVILAQAPTGPHSLRLVPVYEALYYSNRLQVRVNALSGELISTVRLED